MALIFGAFDVEPSDARHGKGLEPRRTLLLFSTKEGYSCSQNNNQGNNMATYIIEINETFNVPRSSVFALFADHNRFGKMLGAPVRRIRNSHQADPNGTGSVRKLGIGPLALKETIVAFEQDTLIEYAITSLSPVRNHLGRIHFGDTSDGQTRVRYTITFDDILPGSGKVLRIALEQGLKRGMRRVPKLA